jgi:septal ring-binding cell division protein DamX
MKTQFGTAGDVRDVDLLAAFVAFWRDRTSGVVSFVRAGGTAAFSLFEGEVVSVSSSEPRFESAAILIRAGKLDAAALERLGVPESSDGALAALQAGILTKREWRWGEKIRAIEILADLLSWNDGKYYFDSDARPASGEFNLAIPRLLLELFLRSRDRHFVDHQLGHTNVPLVRSDEFDGEFTTFGLTADAESVARLIDGTSTADEIAATAPADEFAVRKLLAALSTLGLVKPAERAAEPDMAAPPAPSWDALVTTPLPPHALETSPEPQPEPVQEDEPARREDLEEEAPLEPAYRRDAETWRIPPVEAQEARREEPPLDEYPISESSASRIDEDERGRDPEDRGPAWDPIPAREPVAADEPPPEKSRSGAMLGGVLVGLILLIGAFLYFRSRPVSSGGEPAAAATTAVPTSAVTAAPTAAPAASVSPVSVAPLPGAGAAGRRVAATAPTVPRATAVPPARAAAGKTAVPAAKPTVAAPRAAAPAPAAAAAKPEASAPARGSWTARAARDKKRLAAEKSTRFAIQLELACETPSLVEAWKHDRPAGSMWLLTTTHGGRECFKVLWGRYPTLDAAKRAKARTPAFFQTASNHPAVVRVK